MLQIKWESILRWPAGILDQTNVDVIDLVYSLHDGVIKWKHFPPYWPFVRGMHRWPVNSPHKGQWRKALMFSLICAWTNGYANNQDAGDLRCHHANYDVTVMATAHRRLGHRIKWLGELWISMRNEMVWEIAKRMRSTLQLHMVYSKYSLTGYNNQYRMKISPTHHLLFL